jgi:very-long-chain (3R)-3-hydroxyacyl-CoA dehydratase
VDIVLTQRLGVVRAPLLTTLMQVASRLFLTWGVAYNFPQTTKHSPAYSAMLLAWSVTEVIRYSYFVFVLGGKGVPKILTWLRYAFSLLDPLDSSLFKDHMSKVLTHMHCSYNTFLILYPLGVVSETWLIYSATEPASKIDKWYEYTLWAVLPTYIPGFYMLYTYMLTQRRKVLHAGVGKKRD